MFTGTLLGDMETASISLDQVESDVNAAMNIFTKETSFYIGRLQDDDPAGYVALISAYNNLLAGIISWRSKYRALVALKGKVPDAAWEDASVALQAIGHDLVKALTALRGSVSRSDHWSRVLNFAMAAVGISAQIAFVKLPQIGVKLVKDTYATGKQITQTVVGDAGDILRTAGAAVGDTAGNIFGPVKGILYAAGVVAALYFLAPLFKVAGIVAGRRKKR